MKWRTPETAPKDKLILADFGYPWPFSAIWNSHDEKWTLATLQCCPMEGNTIDSYFENEQEDEKALKGWMPMPATRT